MHGGLPPLSWCSLLVATVFGAELVKAGYSGQPTPEVSTGIVNSTSANVPGPANVSPNATALSANATASADQTKPQSSPSRHVNSTALAPDPAHSSGPPNPSKSPVDSSNSTAKANSSLPSAAPNNSSGTSPGSTNSSGASPSPTNSSQASSVSITQGLANSSGPISGPSNFSGASPSSTSSSGASTGPTNSSRPSSGPTNSSGLSLGLTNSSGASSGQIASTVGPPTIPGNSTSTVGSNGTQTTALPSSNTSSGIEAKIEISIEKKLPPTTPPPNDTQCPSSSDLMKQLDDMMTRLFSSLSNMTQQQRDWACVQAMILEGTNGKRLSCRKINKFAELFITNMTVEKFNSYAQVGMPCSKTKAEIENVEKTKVRLAAPGTESITEDFGRFVIVMTEGDHDQQQQQNKQRKKRRQKRRRQHRRRRRRHRHRRM